MMHHGGTDVTPDYINLELTEGGNAAFRNWHNDFAHVKDPNERRRQALAEVFFTLDFNNIEGYIIVMAIIYILDR